MRLYWEASHFRPCIGYLVLPRIFGSQALPTFGMKVTPATPDRDLQRLSDEKRIWHQQHQFTATGAESAGLLPASTVDFDHQGNDKTGKDADCRENRDKIGKAIPGRKDVIR